VGRESYETISAVFVIRPPPCTGGNEARGISAESSIVKTAGSIREELEAKHDLRVENACGSLRSSSFVVLGLRVGYSLYRGTNEDKSRTCVVLDTSVKILASSTGVCISTFALYLPHLH
jgi:hypothetical protein